MGPAGDVQLRGVRHEDLPTFFEQQCDPDANKMAAVLPRDREALMAHWEKILADPTTVIRTITYDGAVAGNVLTFERSGHREVGYWLGRAFNGKGIATRALAAFLLEFRVRPLYAHVAKHNPASVRVLEKCRFRLVGDDKEFATYEGQAIEGYILMLEAADEAAPS